MNVFRQSFGLLLLLLLVVCGCRTSPAETLAGAYFSRGAQYAYVISDDGVTTPGISVVGRRSGSLPSYEISRLKDGTVVLAVTHADLWGMDESLEFLYFHRLHRNAEGNLDVYSEFDQLHTTDEWVAIDPADAEDFAFVATGDTEAAGRLLQRRPHDPLARIAVLDLAFASADFDHALKRLAEWRDSLLADEAAIIRDSVPYYDRLLEVVRSVEEDRNLYTKIGMKPGLAWPTRGQSYDTWKAGVSSVRDGDIVAMPTNPYFFGNSGLPNFLDLQTMAKLARVESDFLLMQGRTEEAAKLSLEVHRMAVVMIDTSDTMIGRLIGVAVASIAAQSLNHAYLNGYSNSASLRAAFPLLRGAYQHHLKAWHSSELPAGPTPLSDPKPAVEQQAEARTRSSFALARMALVYTGADSRYHYLKLNEIFAGTAVASLLPGPVADPFAPGQPLRKIGDENSTDKVTWYSVGPDGTDQQAALLYDPTNGTISPGDVVLEVSRERHYPFPQPGKLPRSQQDILTMFPNGLPPDPWADNRGASYTVTAGSQATIWSFGPDVDEFRHGAVEGDPRAGVATLDGRRLYRAHPTQPAYDPTNGIISPGNIYLRQ